MGDWFYDHINQITGVAVCMLPIVFGGVIGALCTASKEPEVSELEGYEHEDL